MVVKQGCLEVEASEQAAESHSFAPKWGGQCLHEWTKVWICEREMLMSQRGQHGKVFMLLDNLAIWTELQAYVQSNKWAMNPAKLEQFTKGELILSVTDPYLRKIVNKEMPMGLKKYIEVELFPQIQLKVAKGISLAMARQWLRKEGFHYIGFNKGLYFDGHDRPDVVKYQQEKFLPAMKEYWPRLVKYIVGDVRTEVMPANLVEWPLVLVAQDEMMAQAHNAVKKSWVFQDEHMLRKKGPGHGLHQSDVICSTVGWL
jgi:hypothetical protein